MLGGTTGARRTTALERQRQHPYNSPMRNITRIAIATMIVSVAAITAGCSTQETPVQHAQRVEPLLSAAGFHVLPADNPARQAKLQSLTPLKMRFFPREGKMHYWYADPYFCHCIYSGNEQAYDAYQRIKLQQQMAKQDELSAEMNQDAASQEYMNSMEWPANQVFYGGF
jgi:hypothetical protein